MGMLQNVASVHWQAFGNSGSVILEHAVLVVMNEAESKRWEAEVDEAVNKRSMVRVDGSENMKHD